MNERFRNLLLFILAAVCLPSSLAASPGDAPSNLLSSASSFYQLTAQNQRPWHLKASYQEYDERGNPGEAGEYEYWWSAPGRFRATWTRKGVQASIWSSGNGSAVYVGHPEMISSSEGLMGMALVPTIPAADALNRYSLDYIPLAMGNASLRCVKFSSAPSEVNGGFEIAEVPRLPLICMDPEKPVIVLMVGSSGEIVTLQNPEVFRGDYVYQRVVLNRGKSREWEIKDAVFSDLAPDDPALIPPSSAKPLQKSVPVSSYPSIQPGLRAINGSLERTTVVSEEVGAGFLKTSARPTLPADLAPKSDRHPKAEFQVMIDGSGKICSAQPVSGSPAIQKAALQSLTDYEYRPMHTMDGQPIITETKVTVKF
jgi:hypothetical protein